MGRIIGEKLKGMARLGSKVYSGLKDGLMTGGAGVKNVSSVYLNARKDLKGIGIDPSESNSSVGLMDTGANIGYVAGGIAEAAGRIM